MRTVDNIWVIIGAQTNRTFSLTGKRYEIFFQIHFQYNSLSFVSLAGTHAGKTDRRPEQSPVEEGTSTVGRDLQIQLKAGEQAHLPAKLWDEVERGL